MSRDWSAWFEEALGRQLKWHPNGNALTHCPFHDDRRPSFSVHRWKGTWKCFGSCGGGGVRSLARRLGVSPPSWRRW